MKKFVVTLFIVLSASLVYADSILYDSFEYANHDGESPVGWVCDDNSFVCGYLEKDHNRIPHNGNWYVYTNNTESWMFMQMFISDELKYRYSLWAITDGDYHLEIWAGNSPDPSAMTQLLLNENVSNGSYEKFSAYIEEMAADYQYFGIHATTTGSNNYLTIDEVNVDMVGKYDIEVTPANYYVIAAPGSQVEFKCLFSNLGYEPANVFITKISDYFTNVHLYKDGTACTYFHVEPDESIMFDGVATFTNDIEIGGLGWVDIIFTLDCDCATAMSTLWATAGYESVAEHSITATSVYPNPSSGDVTIEGNGIVSVTNILGQVVLTKEIIEKETVTLPKGIYFVSIDGKTEKLIVE